MFWNDNMFLKGGFVFLLLLVVLLEFSKGEFHCFKNFRSNQKNCGGLLRRKISEPLICCSGQGQGFTRYSLDRLKKNHYTCESCEEWERNLPPTPPPKEEFICFRKYRPRRQQCGGPMRKSKAASPEECCTEGGGGYSLLGQIPRGKNKYTCNSCDDWYKGQTTPATIEHGGWGTWQEWGECSVSCSGGVRQRDRKCDSPAPKNGGKDCEGESMQEERCNEHGCPAPVDGNWGPWSYFGQCSVTCGRGQMTRTRYCNSPPPSGSGRMCVGQSEETRRCEDRKCPIHGDWSEWTLWSDCSGSCGTGERIRTRRCDNPAPQFTGRNCEGSADEVAVCQNQILCPVDGGWSRWGEYGPCRAEPCQRGYRLRVRECDSPRPQNRGRMCVGRSVEQIACMSSEGCPVDGGWCDFGLWSSCSSTCLGDPGAQVRFRACVCPPPENGGKFCEGSQTETQTCEGFYICDRTARDVSRQR